MTVVFGHSSFGFDDCFGFWISNLPGFYHVCPRRQKHTARRAGNHRQRRRISCAAMHGVRHERRRRRDAGKRRTDVRRQSAGVRHGRGSATRNRLQCLDDFCAGAGGGRFNSGSGRCRCRSCRLHHGRNSGDGHDARESADAREEIAADRTELSGHHYARARARSASCRVTFTKREASA